MRHKIKDEKVIRIHDEGHEVVIGSKHSLSLNIGTNEVYSGETVQINIQVISGLDLIKEKSVQDIDKLNYNGEVSVLVDGNKMEKNIINGTVDFDLTINKPADTKVEIVAESLSDHATQSDSATIEVVST